MISCFYTGLKGGTNNQGQLSRWPLRLHHDQLFCLPLWQPRSPISHACSSLTNLHCIKAPDCDSFSAILCSVTCESSQQLFPACLWPCRFLTRLWSLLSWGTYLPPVPGWRLCSSWTFLPCLSPSNLTCFHLRLQDCQFPSTHCEVNKAVLFHSNVLHLVPTLNPDK